MNSAVLKKWRRRTVDREGLGMRFLSPGKLDHYTLED